MAMTREEFAEQYGNSISELRDFCEQVGCGIMSDVLDVEEYNEKMDEMIREMTYRFHWETVLKWLRDQPSSDGTCYYEYGGPYDDYDYQFYFYYYNDTEPWLESVMDWAEEYGYIEEDDDDEMIDSSTDDPAEDFISILKAA